MALKDRSLLLVLPGFLWLGLFMVLPCAIIFAMAFFERGVYGGIDYGIVTAENFRRAFDPLYLSILLDSARIAFAAPAASGIVR